MGSNGSDGPPPNSSGRTREVIDKCSQLAQMHSPRLNKEIDFMRPTWKGSISFGLVYIPIAVYPATREEKLSFRQLRKTDLSPIRYKKVAEADMKEVPADQIVKGFDCEGGRYRGLRDGD